MTILGPSVGAVTATTAKIWISVPSSKDAHVVFVRVEEKVAKLTLESASHYAATATFRGLNPDTKYEYRVYTDEACTMALELEGLSLDALHFTTLPAGGCPEQLDFVLVSCHNPDKAREEKLDGFSMWRALPQVLEQNQNVRFAIMAGDQVYCDDIEERALSEEDPHKRAELFDAVYRRQWGDLDYRTPLASLPSYLLWDDHDITDGWGSRDESFAGDSSSFSAPWLGLFESARKAFIAMQASRNPDGGLFAGRQDQSFDVCFRVGNAGFCLADLRSNRNARDKHIWHEEQLAYLRRWVTEQQRQDTAGLHGANKLDTLFFVTPVVFAHGAPTLEKTALKVLSRAMQVLHVADGFPILGRLTHAIENYTDITDDIKDAWGSPANIGDAEQLLSYLFDLQNPAIDPKSGTADPINVVVLTGDIHMSGCANLFSKDKRHSLRPLIPQIVSSPVAYPAAPWALEAYVRSLTKTVPFGSGDDPPFRTQISHHFTERAITVVSLRNVEGRRQLKVKFYLEGYEEPQIVLFDLEKVSHLESIRWT